jgi:hypothetical protein
MDEPFQKGDRWVDRSRGPSGHGGIRVANILCDGTRTQNLLLEHGDTSGKTYDVYRDNDIKPGWRRKEFAEIVRAGDIVTGEFEVNLDVAEGLPNDHSTVKKCGWVTCVKFGYGGGYYSVGRVLEETGGLAVWTRGGIVVPGARRRLPRNAHFSEPLPLP